MDEQIGSRDLEGCTRSFSQTLGPTRPQEAAKYGCDGTNVPRCAFCPTFRPPQPSQPREASAPQGCKRRAVVAPRHRQAWASQWRPSWGPRLRPPGEHGITFVRHTAMRTGKTCHPLPCERCNLHQRPYNTALNIAMRAGSGYRA